MRSDLDSQRRRSLSPRHLDQSSLPVSLRRPRLAHRPNSLRSSHANQRPRRRRRSLPNTPGRPNPNRNIGISPPLLSLHHDESVPQTPQGQARSRPGAVVVVESDGAAAAVGPADGKVLAQVAVVFRPQLVLGAVAGVVAVEGMAGVIGGVVGRKGFDDVEFDKGVVGETVEGQVGVSGGVVGCGVIYHSLRGWLAGWLDGWMMWWVKRVDEQILASTVAFAGDEVAACA